MKKQQKWFIFFSSPSLILTLSKITIKFVGLIYMTHVRPTDLMIILKSEKIEERSREGV